MSTPFPKTADTVKAIADASAPPKPRARKEVVIDCNIKELYYGKFKAVRDAHIPIEKNTITAFIGPSGCGKSTALRCINRMNDLVHGFRFVGHVHYRGVDMYGRKVDPVTVRRHIGMVFQQPNPFHMSIFSNVAFGLRLNRFKGDIHAQVEKSLRRAPRSGMRLKTSSRAAACRSRAGSSNGSALPALSPRSLKCCSWTSLARPSTRSQPGASRN